MKRIIAALVVTAGLLAGSGAPSQAQDIKKFEGTITAPLPVVSNQLAAMEDFCPGGGDLNGTFYRFFDLGAEYKHFYVSGPALIIDQPEPTGVKGGNYQDYDVDLTVFNSKCQVVDGDGPINKQMGVGAFTAARPVRYAAINYYAGPYTDIPMVLEASNEKIKK
ncbi:MAG TPA: hypothetical protein VMY88_03435 [Acidimicrobiales bacterium]|nr:hypothetical protein [Acidimicrobiales bacterium]